MYDHVVISVRPLYTPQYINPANTHRRGIRSLVKQPLLPISVKSHQEPCKAIYANSAISPVLDTRYDSHV